MCATHCEAIDDADIFWDYICGQDAKAELPWTKIESKRVKRDKRKKKREISGAVPCSNTKKAAMTTRKEVERCDNEINVAPAEEITAASLDEETKTEDGGDGHAATAIIEAKNVVNESATSSVVDEKAPATDTEVIRLSIQLEMKKIKDTNKMGNAVASVVGCKVVIENLGNDDAPSSIISTSDMTKTTADKLAGDINSCVGKAIGVNRIEIGNANNDSDEIEAPTATTVPVPDEKLTTLSTAASADMTAPATVAVDVERLVKAAKSEKNLEDAGKVDETSISRFTKFAEIATKRVAGFWGGINRSRERVAGLSTSKENMLDFPKEKVVMPVKTGKLRKQVRGSARGCVIVSSEIKMSNDNHTTARYPYQTLMSRWQILLAQITHST